MKNTITLMLLLSIFMAACKKDKNELTPDEGKTANVKFTVSNFTQTVENFKTAKVSADSIGAPPGPLYVRIYDLGKTNEYGEPGILTFGTNFSSVISNNYNIINTQLPHGNYVAFFISSNSMFSKYFGLGSGLENEKCLNNAFFFNVYNGYITDIPIEETFFKKINFTVGPGITSYSVVMQRIVAGLEVQILDSIPSNVEHIQVAVYDHTSFGFMSETSGVEYYKRANMNLALKKLNMFVLGPGPREVTITAYDSQWQPVAGKYLAPEFFRNKKTVVKGNLFSSDVGFLVGANLAWDEEPPATTFTE